MPKRKLTPKRIAQIRAFQAAGAQARARQSGKRLGAVPIRNIRAVDRQWNKPWAQTRTPVRPYGKTRLLYHRTSSKAATAILKKGFKGTEGWMSGAKVTYFSDQSGQGAKSFGKTVLEVRVSKSRLGQIRPRSAHQGLESRRLQNAGKPLPRNDPDRKWRTTHKAETWLEIPTKRLKGVKVRRLP